MATKKSEKEKQIIFAIAAIAVLAFVIVFSGSGQTAKFYAAKPQSTSSSFNIITGTCYSNSDCPANYHCERLTPTTKGTCVINPLTVGLKAGESAIFNGKTITMTNVGSAPTNAPVIVVVDGIAETVTGTETVNGVTVKVEATLFWEKDIKLRYAILTLS